jgi:hypothetical protein
MRGISPLAKELLVSGGGFCFVGVARRLVPMQQITRASPDINYELKKNKNYLVNFLPFASVI